MDLKPTYHSKYTEIAYEFSFDDIIYGRSNGCFTKIAAADSKRTVYYGGGRRRSVALRAVGTETDELRGGGVVCSRSACCRLAGRYDPAVSSSHPTHSRLYQHAHTHVRHLYVFVVRRQQMSG